LVANVVLHKSTVFTSQMVNEKFIELITKKLSGELSAGDSEEFKEFLATDADFRQQYSLFKSYWSEGQGAYTNSDLMFRKIENKINIIEHEVKLATAEERKQKIFVLWRNVAAVFLLGSCLSLGWLFLHSKTNAGISPSATLELTKTPSRVKSKITLSDGSIVTLNSETTLKYPTSFDGQTREVYLNGEAFFDVAKDHKHPFIVHTGKMSIRVLGTAFNVKSYANDAESETTLIRGAIEVTLADRPSDRIILKPHDKLILKNNSFKKYRPNKYAAIAVDSVRTHYALTNLTYFKSNDSTIIETSWVNNKMVFKDENFDDLAIMMERWYGVKIKFKNNDVKAYRFTGIFEKESITEALNALQLIENFNYKQKNETINIY